MTRRTITLDPGLAAAIDDAVAAGTARNVSRFMSAAALHYLEALRAERLGVESRALDPAEELRLAEGAAPRGTRWNRVR